MPPRLPTEVQLYRKNRILTAKELYTLRRDILALEKRLENCKTDRAKCKRNLCFPLGWQDNYEKYFSLGYEIERIKLELVNMKTELTRLIMLIPPTR